MKKVKIILKEVCKNNNWDYKETLKWYLDYWKELELKSKEYKYLNIQIENLGTLLIRKKSTERLLKSSKSSPEDKVKLEHLLKRIIERDEDKISRNQKKRIQAYQNNKTNIPGIQTAII